MTDFSDLKASIADWANRQDWSDALVTNFIRQAEQKLNAELRVDRMIKRSQATVMSCCAQLPDDWLQSDLVLIASANAPTGWCPIRYKPRDEFFRLPSVVAGSNAWTSNTTTGFYTVEGRSLYFGGQPDAVNGKAFELNYYAEVPVISDATPSWVYTKYPSLYLYGSLMHADMHAVGEEQNASNLMNLVENMIGKLNADHLRAKSSGSRLARARVRSFG